MSLEKPQDAHIDSEIEALRKNLVLYNGLQRKLMLLKYGSKDEVNAHYEEWEYMYSQEFEEAFKQVMKEAIENDPEFLANFTQSEEQTLERIQKRVELFHSIEQKLISHVNENVSVESIEWHKSFGKGLMEILHNDPQLLQEYLASQDKSPHDEQVVLREIEDILYTK